MATKPPPRAYPPEFRHKVLELARSGRSIAEISRQFEVSRQTIMNWIGNCCYVARMTTIARDSPYVFTGDAAGYTFGPAKWFGAYTHTVSGIDPTFAFGGTESYPNSKTYVAATSVKSDHSETDQVFLPPAIQGSLR